MATRNRYAEIMSQFGQSQPFSFFGMPSGGLNPYASDYTGGFTPNTPQPAAPVTRYEEIMAQPAMGGGGRGISADEGGTFTEPTSEQAYNVSTLGRNLTYVSPLFGGLASMYGNYLASQVNPNYSNEGRNYPAPTGGFLSSEAAPTASTGTLSFAPPTDAQYGAYLAQQQADAAGREYGTGAVPPGVSANQFAANYAAYNNPNAVAVPSQDGGFVEGRTNLSSLVYGPNPSLTASIAAQAQAQADASAAAAAQAPVQTIIAREIYRGEENVPEGNWTSRSLGRGDREYFRDVAVPVDRFTDSEGNFNFSALARAGLSIPGIGGGQGSSGGGYTVGGYAPGSQAAAAAASGTVGGYGPGTPGFNAGMTGLAKGGYVSMQHLGGPDPEGPDDGYAALKDGEFVINDKAVKKYGIELMNLINSGKISKGKLRGLLEM